MIRTIEEIALNAWPAKQTFLYDGWVLRFHDGYTRRANSALALYPGLLDPQEKIGLCEELYRQQNLPVIFKLPGRAEAAELDQFLAARGYASEAETSVQTMDLSPWSAEPEAAVLLAPVPGAEWDAAFCRFSGINASQHTAHMQILGSIQAQTGYALLVVNGAVVGCGLGVMQAGYLGLFDIVIDPTCRGLGYGKQLMRGLLHWGKAQGAHTAYLQVMLNNPRALRLYAGLGFEEIYQYWYRVKA